MYGKIADNRISFMLTIFLVVAKSNDVYNDIILCTYILTCDCAFYFVNSPCYFQKDCSDDDDDIMTVGAVSGNTTFKSGLAVPRATVHH